MQDENTPDKSKNGIADESLIIEATPFRRAQEDKSRSFIKIRPLPTAITIVFLGLATAAAFMFTARAVRISINPEPDTFRFTSGFSYQLGERYLMLQGNYTFTAAKSGYHILSTSIDVDDNPDQEFAFELKKLPGILKVSTDPETAAKIYIDQQLVGTSPLRLDEIAPGLHDIRIRSARYMDYDTEISIEGKREIQSLQIPLAPAWANITLSSQPAAADILIDDNLVSTTPNQVEALQGERNIQVRKKGFKTWQMTIDVIAGIDQTLDTIILEKSDGKVSIRSSPSGANVNINGRYRGQTPVQLTLAPAREYEVKLSKAGYEPLIRTISVQPEGDLSLNNKLSPILGIVQLMVSPDGAELFVDGKSFGEPSQRLSLTASQHELKIIKAGYADKVIVVTPRPGSSQQLLIRLQTEDEARVAAIPTTIETALGQTLNLIIPGEFSMGAGRREPGRRSNEIQKEVQLTKAYYLATMEVTNQQFKQFDPGHDSGILGRAVLNGEDRPVVNLTWIEAIQFCNWLSARDGLEPAYENVSGRLQAATPLNSGYRLPTEAEWVWAARYAAGPNPSRFPWGDNMPPRTVAANYADESAFNMVPYHISGYEDAYRGPSPGDTYPANEFGIHDLAGNVAEWIHDYYSVSIPKQKLIDPSGTDVNDYHVIRGSSYKHGRFSELRWTYRDYGDKARADVGFRIARFVE